MKYFSLLLLGISVGLFAAGCTKSTPAPSGAGSNTTTPADDHDHEGHDHEGHEHEGETGTPASAEAPATDDFGAPPAEPPGDAGAVDGAEPEISLDSASPEQN
jgi:hypothetical protein